MKQDFRSHALVKAAALLLTVACGVAAVFSWVYCIFWWNSLFESDTTYSVAWSRAMSDRYSSLMSLLDDYDAKRRGQSLGYVEEQYYQELLSSMDPKVTNFRYIIRDNVTGDILLSSSGKASLDHIFDDTLTRHVRTISPGRIHYSSREYDEERNITLFFDNNGGFLVQVPGNVDTAYQEGDIYQYALEFGVDSRGEVRDEFWEAIHTDSSRADIRVLYLAVAVSAAFLIGTVFLMCCAGRRQGADTFTLNWTDKIPYDLYLFALFWAVFGAFAMGFHAMAEEYYYFLGYPVAYAWQGLGGALLVVGFALGEAVLMSTAARIKTHTLLKNTLIWYLLSWFGRGCRAVGRAWRATFGSWSLTHRIIVGFLLYLVGTVLTAPTIILIPVYQGAILFLLCRWAEEWRKIRQGTQAIVGGAPETVIDTAGMKRFDDLRSHAEALNDLGSAINTAVDERLKSERMKAELITNVSHDLKTPLTSIINYVDLLKKEDIPGEKAQEYIEVLDRKSQRLKKLTEDLVEASKASTGTLQVNRERLGLVQLMDQALGEYNEKLAGAGLTLVAEMPADECYIEADGRHVWRIIDNLLGNCVKYAMTGTRVYLDLHRWDGWVTMSLKNISASQLNIPAEQLMERFVRGDESRTTEGSGLGLSIARSLTELQGGLFRLEVDGDLFKAVVSFPEVK